MINYLQEKIHWGPFGPLCVYLSIATNSIAIKFATIIMVLIPEILEWFLEYFSSISSINADREPGSRFWSCKSASNILHLQLQFWYLAHPSTIITAQRIAKLRSHIPSPPIFNYSIEKYEKYRRYTDNDLEYIPPFPRLDKDNCSCFRINVHVFV